MPAVTPSLLRLTDSSPHEVLEMCPRKHHLISPHQNRADELVQPIELGKGVSLPLGSPVLLEPLEDLVDLQADGGEAFRT